MSKGAANTGSADRLETARRDACRAALAAWRAIEPMYLGEYAIEHKKDGPATDADKLADRLIVDSLSRHYEPPEYGYLTEESEDSMDRLGAERIWIVDPIDGTRDFIKRNGNFAVHIALAERQHAGPRAGTFQPVVAVVFRPVLGLIYSAIAGRGAWCRRVHDSAQGDVRGIPIRVSERARLSELRSVVSNSNQTSRLMRLIESLGLEDYWRVGSLGVKVATIAEGGAELYVVTALGMVKEWDVCAPHLLLAEAGGRMTDLLGRELEYNRRDVRFRTGLVASNGTIHGELVDRILAFLAEEGVMIR